MHSSAPSARVPALYIADGHHRAASAARARDDIRQKGGAHPLGDGADFNTFLAVAFPHDQVQILAYNRIVKDLAGLSAEAFLAAVGERFAVSPGPAMPARRGDIAMYLPRSMADAAAARRAGSRAMRSRRST